MDERIYICYRTHDLEPIDIAVHLDHDAIAKACDAAENHTIPMQFDQPRKRLFQHFHVELSYEVLVNCRRFFKDTGALKEEIVAFAKWLAKTNRFHGFYLDDRVLIAYEDGTECPLEIREDRVFFALGETFRIEENRTAKQLVLEVAYKRAEKGILFQDLHTNRPVMSPNEKDVSFPVDVMLHATRVLESSGFLAREEGRSLYRITLKGQLKYEENFASFQDKAFIIASCSDRMRPIIKIYKDVLAEPEFKLEGIFQEDEEPAKSIHLDIFDYIRNVSLIITDLTDHRSNCYLELGYAMALNKRIILALNETDRYYPGTEKDRLAFDTTPMRYTFYKTADELKEKIRERIRVSLNIIRKAAEI